MMEFVDFAISMQKRVIDAHEQSIEAARKTLDASSSAVKMQEAMQQATKANMKAWDSWLSMWGLRK